MTFRTLAATALLTAASLAPALAAERAVTLAVENMTCPSCPYIVKKALGKIAGVEAVAVSYEEKRATVTFEDTEVTVEDLTAATADVGFPSRVVKPDPREGQQ